MKWELGTGFLLTAKEIMNNLSQIREKIKSANRLYGAQLLATKNGEVTPYRRSVFEERIGETQKKNEIERLKKLNSYFNQSKRRGFNPLFFGKFINNLFLTIYFPILDY